MNGFADIVLRALVDGLFSSGAKPDPQPNASPSPAQPAAVQQPSTPQEPTKASDYYGDTIPVNKNLGPSYDKGEWFPKKPESSLLRQWIDRNKSKLQ